MILEIKLENFYSIKNEITIDFQAGEIESEILDELENNYFEYNGKKYLKSIVIYGANASGKSNILKAIQVCHLLILNSDNLPVGQSYPFENFKLNPTSVNGPSKFSIRFVLNRQEYCYSFSISLLKNEVLEEQLIQVIEEEEELLFSRKDVPGKEHHVYEINTKIVDKGTEISDLTRKDVLFLNRLYSLNSVFGKKIIEFFILYFIRDINLIRPKEAQKSFEIYKKKLEKVLQYADSDILRIEQEQITTPIPDRKNFIGNVMVTDRLVTYHKSNPTVKFDFENEESNGTKKLFRIMLNFLHLVKYGKAVLFDELESSLHPKLVEFVLSFFHAGEHAQLIFTSHNTNLIDLHILRKDQIYFANKKEDGSTELYSLFDFEDWPENMNPELDYLNGKFDAIPYINDSKISLKSLLDG